MLIPLNQVFAFSSEKHEDVWVVRSKSVWKAAIGLFSAVVRWFGAVKVLPKIAHTRSLIGEPIAELPQGLGKGWSHSSISDHYQPESRG
jgi:hypothetical protein